MEKLILFVGFIICLGFCRSCTKDYVNGGPNKEDVEKFEKMLNDKTSTIAELYDGKSSTTKISFVPVHTTYTYKYHYEVNGKRYDYEHDFGSNEPKTSSLTIYYLQDDPSFHSFEDPKALLEYEKTKEPSVIDLIAGIGWGIVALILLISIF